MMYNLPQFTLDDYEDRFAGRHRLHDVVAYWAKQRPESQALVAAETGRTVNWRDFDRYTLALAARLKRMGLGKGDFVVTLLPMSVDHVLIEYACFRLGAIVVPLDLRLSAAEIFSAFEVLKPRAFFGLGVKGPLDLRPLWAGLRERCPWVEIRVAVDSAEPVEGAAAYGAIHYYVWRAAMTCASISSVGDDVGENDGALVIFTTGSTGSPKPALLSHRNITVQNMCLSGAFFGGDRGPRSLVNLPASHVGGQTELLMSTLFGGGAAVLVEIFDAARSLRAVGQHNVEILGQIPVMFNLEWMLKDYANYDLSSLKFAAYGGNAVSRPFIGKLAAMAPFIGTGLGLTETAGFCTYFQAGSEDQDTIQGGLGVDMPIYPCTIREPMREDGTAGTELPEGETGHVCFRGPQSFLGYVGDAESTRRTISSDGFLYTGDLGCKKERSLQLTGRAKWVIKSLGYQIYPGDVEAHVCLLEGKVANCVVVGVAHAAAAEAPVAVVEKHAGAELTRQELDRHARSLPSYMRPRHWILLEPGQMPLNRIVKPDYLRAQEMAHREIAEMRARGEWDSSYLQNPVATSLARTEA
jgi:acyl-CoA synthetase (AMP-forming)/AMP-acid ligase II